MEKQTRKFLSFWIVIIILFLSTIATLIFQAITLKGFLSFLIIFSLVAGLSTQLSATKKLVSAVYRKKYFNNVAPDELRKAYLFFTNISILNVVACIILAILAEKTFLPRQIDLQGSLISSFFALSLICLVLAITAGLQDSDNYNPIAEKIELILYLLTILSGVLFAINLTFGFSRLFFVLALVIVGLPVIIGLRSSARR
jgi:hypothetical protein